MLAGNRNVVFSVASDVEANIDKHRMKQVILNLFQNAVQHTDSETGKIHVSVTRLPNGNHLEVQDNGVGISPEHQSKLFERFYRVDAARSRSSGGSGLGLSITKSIVESHGGRITCESVVGEGSTFRVWLPSAN